MRAGLIVLTLVLTFGVMLWIRSDAHHAGSVFNALPFLGDTKRPFLYDLAGLGMIVIFLQGISNMVNRSDD